MQGFLLYVWKQEYESQFLEKVEVSQYKFKKK